MSENMYLANGTEEENLLTQGFTKAEAEKLIFMREHVEEQAEYRDMVAEQHRLAFLRWLVEHDRIQ